ncbi:MAG: sugar transferase [Candidatus Nanoarchaeia archaeon]
MRRNFWSGKKKYFFVLLYFSDVIAFLASAIFATKIVGLDFFDSFYLRVFVFALIILVLTYSNYKLYDDKRNLFDDSDFMNIMYSNSLIFIILLLFILMFDPQDSSLMFALALTIAISILLTTIGRIILNKIIFVARIKGFDVKKTIFFGEENDELLTKLESKHLGYRVIKVTKDKKVLKNNLNKADIVFLKMEAINDELLELITKNDQISWKIVSSILNLVIDPVAFDEFKDYPIINVSSKESSKRYLWAKRVFDLFFSSIALIVLSPFFLIIALIIKLTSKGPVFFRQERLGLNLKPFMLYKFRTMRDKADKEKTHLKNEVKGLFKMKEDPRITKIGKFLRRSCIDELPQVINIFLGHMSFVGPRPHLQQELSNFKGWRMARFKVKPGLTGLWQVNGRHELNFDKAVLYDIYYVKHMSLLLDATIVMKTIPSIMMTNGKY